MDPESKSGGLGEEMAIGGSENWKKVFYFAELGVRVLVIAFSVAGAVTMLTSNESVTIFGMTMNASYNYSSAFRYKVVADCVTSGVTVLSVILLISLNQPKSNNKNYFYLLFIDLVNLVLVVGACSAAIAIGLVGMYGEAKMGWISICDRVGDFCDKMMASIVISCLSLLCLFLLNLMSAYKLAHLTSS